LLSTAASLVSEITSLPLASKPIDNSFSRRLWSSLARVVLHSRTGYFNLSETSHQTLGNLGASG
jgi:hypothetical protein